MVFERRDFAVQAEMEMDSIELAGAEDGREIFAVTT